MLFYYLFWMIMGFIIHFYITFETNLLTGGPTHIAVLLPISVFRRKGISNGVQTEWNLWECNFWNKHDPGDLEFTSEDPRGGHEIGGRAHPPGHALPSRGPLEAPPTNFVHLYKPTYPKNIDNEDRSGVPPSQAFVATKNLSGSHSGTLPEGESPPLDLMVFHPLYSLVMDWFSLWSYLIGLSL